MLDDNSGASNLTCGHRNVDNLTCEHANMEIEL